MSMSIGEHKRHNQILIQPVLGEEGNLSESASRPLVGFGVLNDNLIKYLISFVEVHE
jgi:hypothetical protein